ncbi:MAG: glycosyltransferase family 2 protein [Bryobacteraceae bacterium]
MNSASPRVSVGLPVFNGERFVEAAIRGILTQTYEDLELIVSDNASTDRTPEICRDYAVGDKRVVYHREDTNIGAKANFNRTFELSRGAYFKWAAADDVCGPRYLARTVDVLDRDPSAILAHCHSAVINAEGRLVGQQELKDRLVVDNGLECNVSPNDRERRLDNPRAAIRFGEILLGTFWCFEIFALIRRAGMLATYPKGQFFGSDKVMLAQLSLMGRFVEIDDVQFYRRAHSDNSCNLSVHAREAWSRRKAKKLVLPTEFPCFAGYTRALCSSPLGLRDRIECTWQLVRFAARFNRYPKLVNQLWQIVSGRLVAPAKVVAPELSQSPTNAAEGA